MPVASRPLYTLGRATCGRFVPQIDANRIPGASATRRQIRHLRNGPALCDRARREESLGCAVVGRTVERGSPPNEPEVTVDRLGNRSCPPSPEKAPDTPRLRLVAVIDDDALVLEATGELLMSWGYRVLTASSDRAALARIGEHERCPDLIICDYRLSAGRTGIEVIAQLRTILAVPIPSVIISGDTLPERLRELRASGHHLLYKPVAPATLKSLVGRCRLRQGPVSARC
jgi:CheY-like chemotaxis protein